MHRTVALLPVIYGSTLFVGALLLFSIQELHADSEWRCLEKRVGATVWTDDFSDVFNASEWQSR